MSADSRFRVEQDPTYGVVLRCTDTEMADIFEDFLSENRFVLFKTKFEDDEVLFYFGQASSLEAVAKLVEQFESGSR